MSHWKANAARAVLAAAVVAGGYLCTIGAYDHRRPPESGQPGAGAEVLAAAEPAATTCVREAGGGITCTEEIVVVAPRRPERPVLVTQRTDRARPAGAPEEAQR